MEKKNSKLKVGCLVGLICINLYQMLASRMDLLNTPTVSLQRGKTPPPNECPVYDTKQSDGDVPVMLELWGIRSTSSLPLLPGLLWLGVRAPDRVVSMGQIELNWELLLNLIAWNMTVLTFKLHTNPIYPTPPLGQDIA